jgi:tetratricopeptide (TPR) repeat protein
MRAILTVAAVLALSAPALAQEELKVPEPGDAPAVEAPAPEAAPAEAQVQKKPAEIRAEQLDILFARLHKSDASADAIQQKIQALWGASDSPTAEVLLQQAQKAIEAGAPAEAMSILDRLIGANPDFAEAWNKRATLYFMMKRDDASLKDIEKVLDLEPRHFGALAGKGMILKRQKKYSAAREAFEDALAINPTLEQVKAAIKELERLEQGI